MKTWIFIFIFNLFLAVSAQATPIVIPFLEGSRMSSSRVIEGWSHLSPMIYRPSHQSLEDMYIMALRQFLGEPLGDKSIEMDLEKALFQYVRFDYYVYGLISELDMTVLGSQGTCYIYSRYDITTYSWSLNHSQCEGFVEFKGE